jgi:hypothetical protein
MSDQENLWYGVASALLNFAENSERPDQIVKAMTCILTPFMQGRNYKKYFRLFEAEGIHLTPVHFYAPIPDTRTLNDDLFSVDSKLPGIEMNDRIQLSLLKQEFPKFQDEYDRIRHEPTGNPHEYYFNNEYFSGIDACALYCMVRHFTPNLIIEVGSGYSSLLNAQAAQKNGNTELICIEPNPAEVLKNGFPCLKQLVTTRVQDTEPSFFEQLRAGDILFIDSTHVVQIGSDVNFLFLEVLPRLKPGVIVHIHDIYLPAAGRRDWVMEDARFWNEQYLLQAFLIRNKEFEVLFATYYLAVKYLDDLTAAFPKAPCEAPYWHGSSFWMRRTL